MAACVFWRQKLSTPLQEGVPCDPNRGIRKLAPATSVTPKVCAGKAWPLLQSDTNFVQFNGHAGVFEPLPALITYQDKRLTADGSRVSSVREIIERWAPASENNTDAYALTVARALAIDPDYRGLDVRNFDTMRALVLAIIRHENGLGPLPGGQWYGESVVVDGLALAGVERVFSTARVRCQA